jgi:large subunit ribosomal protein L25
VSEVRIAAQTRKEFGKGGARRTRRAGQVPAVLYGHGTPPRHIALPAREFSHALKTDAGINVLLRVDIDGTSELALAKAIQRNPVRGDIQHVDLLLVRRGEQVSVEVPVTLVGEVVSGGLLDHQLVTLSVTAEATHIPESVQVPIDGLSIGSSVHAADVSLPAGVALAADPDAVVVHVLAAPTAAQLEAELAEAQAEVAGVPAAAPEAPAAPPPVAPSPEGEGAGGDSAG